MTSQLDMFSLAMRPNAVAADDGRSPHDIAGDEPETRGPASPGSVIPSPFDPRPPYDQAGEWDRMVRVIRATDKLRALHGLTGPELEVVHVAGVARLRAREAPQIWTEL